VKGVDWFMFRSIFDIIKLPQLSNVIFRRLGRTYRKPRISYVITCHFHTPEVPTEPTVGALKEVEGQSIEGLDIVQRLFNSRPVWSRRAVMYHLGDKAKRVKYLLPCVAYYWIGGPWRTFWTKFGYDPRKNPAAKM
jgi:general transcription factor 3C polypeptide 5 (transcription factor C subunit 1)